MKYAPELKKGEISAKIQEQLAEGPKTADELLGPRWLVAYRVTALNRFYRKIGSHWRIKGTRNGAVTTYAMTMEL